MVKKDPVEEARRYVENAKTLLVEHGDQNKDVCDSCFRMANEIIDRCAVMLPKVSA